MKMDAFILAAGRGERLRPLTDAIPKPLVEVGGRSLIEHHLAALSRAGFERVVVNVSWLGDAIERALGSGARYGLDVRYSREPGAPLGTARGIARARALIRSPWFLAVNADVRTDFDFAALEPCDDADLVLVMVDNPPHHRQGDFALHDGCLGEARAARAALTYSGIGCFRRALFKDDGPRELRALIEAAVAHGRARGLYFDGPWIDVGTGQRLRDADGLERKPLKTGVRP